MMPIPQDVSDEFGAMIATVKAVDRVLVDLLERVAVVAERINTDPTLCTDGRLGNPTLEVIEGSGWLELTDRLAIIDARLERAGIGFGFLDPDDAACEVPDWLADLSAAHDRDHQVTVDAWREHDRRRVAQLERVLFELTTAGIDLDGEDRP